MHKKIKLIIIIILIILSENCSVKIKEGLTEEQADEILVLLQSYGIKSEKSEYGSNQSKKYSILVPKESAEKAWRILKDNDLPSENEKGIDDIFNRNRLIPTTTEERALYLKALQGELAKTLKTIDGVIQARVHLVLPEDSLFPNDEVAYEPKAAVFIKYSLKEDGSIPFDINEIKSLVANSVKGLKSKNVEIVAKEISNPFKQNNYQLTEFGPLKITKDTAKYFKIFCLVNFIIYLFLFLIIFFLTNQLNRLEKKAKAYGKKL